MTTRVNTRAPGSVAVRRTHIAASFAIRSPGQPFYNRSVLSPLLARSVGWSDSLGLVSRTCTESKVIAFFKFPLHVFQVFLSYKSAMCGTQDNVCG